MIVLGICDSQDAGAALFADGRLVAAVNEERLNRVKLWGGFPAASVREVLRLAGVAPGRVAQVVLGTRITPNLLARACRGAHQPLRRASGQFGALLGAFVAYQTAARALGLPLALEAAAARWVIGRDLARLGIRAPLAAVDHHAAHAASAWATSPFERALVVTVDGLGDGLGLTASVGERGRGLRRVHAESGLSSITLYYSRLTEHLGFRAIRDEGKVNALAACVDRTPAIDAARALLSCRDGRFVRQPHLFGGAGAAPWRALGRWTREEVAASFQTHLEAEMRAFLRHWLRATGAAHVALAGGLFANVKLNQRIAAMDEVRGVWVFPHMGDGGLAAGGVLAWLGAAPAPLAHVFLGPEPEAAAIERAVAASGLPARRCPAIELEAARRLAAGALVARVAGRMEYGPRALGNRSLLAPATDPQAVARLNRRLQRSPFMPFAPAVLDEAFDACFTGGARVREATRFMTVSLDATPWMRARLPAVVHADGTGRPQRVGDELPRLARLLREYRRLTGLPAVVNTSFNLHEEPIVCGAEEALSTFRRAGIDYLAIGDWLVAAPAGTVAP